MGIKVKGNGVWSMVPSIILVLAILGALGVLAYAIAKPKVEKFTEFYILGLESKAVDYPEELVIGEEGKVLMVIANREQEVATYWVEVAIEGVKNNELGAVTLEDGEKWEGTVNFTPEKVGDNQKIEFLLYRQGRDGVYQRLHLWVDVQ